MFILKKKEVLQELAISLFLMMELDPSSVSPYTIERLKEKSRDALCAAEIYTGELGDKDLRKFIEAKPQHFTISCGSDIVKGDTIRFLEQVESIKTNSKRIVGNRGVIAEVLGMTKAHGQEKLRMRVLSSGGICALFEGEEIDRTIKIVTRMEVMRAPWDDETKRISRSNCLKVVAEQAPTSNIKSTSQHALGRYDVLKERRV